MNIKIKKAFTACAAIMLCSATSSALASEQPTFLKGKVEIKEHETKKKGAWEYTNSRANESMGVNKRKPIGKGSSQTTLTHIPKYDTIPLEGSSRSVKLTDAEIQLISKMENELLKRLYQERKLSEARELLIENETKKQKERELRNKLDPDEIIEYRKYQKRIEEAQHRPLGKDLSLVTRSVDVDLGSAKPIDIQISSGYVSSIVFYDQTGKPWPIEGEVIGDKNAFNSTIVSINQNIASLEIKRPFATSNALVVLDGLDVPLVFRLTSSDTSIDSRLTVRIPKFGPNAEVAPFVNDRLENASPEMVAIMDGDWTKLKSAKRYNLNGVDGEAYLYNGYLYVRSPHLLLIPASEQRFSSPSGYQITKLAPTENLVFSVDGERVYAEITKAREVKINHKDSIFK